ncbi:MAG: type II secretion system F family protein [Isosphaeraceae bacterium]
MSTGPLEKTGDSDDWLGSLMARQAAEARSGGWRLSHFMWLIVGVALLLWLYVIYGGVVIAGGLVILFAAAVGLGVILARRRISQQDSLLWILAIAAERSMPLGQTLLAFADQYGGRVHRRIHRLASLLEDGVPVAEALDQVPRLISRDALLLAHVGQRTGRLPEALRMAASSRSSQLPIWTAIASRFAYLLFILISIQGICGFLLYFILPKFEAIFRDFGLPLPTATIGLIEGSHWLLRLGPLLALVPPVEVILLVMIPFSFAGWANYDVPFFDRMLKRRHSALILRALSLSVAGKKPIESGMSTLADYYPTWWVRRRLIRTENHVQHGADWIDELRRQHLFEESDREVLEAASAVGNLEWAMRELAETKERRLAFRFQAAIQTLFPLVILAIGAGIFLLAIAFFAPLVELIRRLT